MNALMLALATLLSADAADPKETSMIVTVKGALLAEGKPVTDAHFALRPTSSHTAVDVAKSGSFTIKAVASRSYVVDVWAEGFAPLQREVELDASGTADLGRMTLDRLVTMKVTAVVAPRGKLAGAAEQQLELQHGACAQIRAQDDSGCLVSFCVTQQRGVLTIDRHSSGSRTLGKVALKDALTRLPRGGTFVTGIGVEPVQLVRGETVAFQPPDAWCAGLLHVEEPVR